MYFSVFSPEARNIYGMGCLSNSAQPNRPLRDSSSTSAGFLPSLLVEVPCCKSTIKYTYKRSVNNNLYFM